MPETRVIKRYANRKLYDTQRSRYVTLEQIAEMIRSGEDVRIVDNNSKDDLTSVTLAQIIFEEEKRKSFLPLSAMRNIIQSGGESIQELASQAGARVREVFGLGEQKDMLEAPPPVDDAAAESGGATHAMQAALREFFERSQQTFDEWQKRVDERVQKVVEALAPWTGLEKEMRDLGDRLGQLEKRLSEHETKE